MQKLTIIQTKEWEYWRDLKLPDSKLGIVPVFPWKTDIAYYIQDDTVKWRISLEN